MSKLIWYEWKIFNEKYFIWFSSVWCDCWCKCTSLVKKVTATLIEMISFVFIMKKKWFHNKFAHIDLKLIMKRYSRYFATVHLVQCSELGDAFHIHVQVLHGISWYNNRSWKEKKCEFCLTIRALNSRVCSHMRF